MSSRTTQAHHPLTCRCDRCRQRAARLATMRALAPLPTVHGAPKHTVKRIDRPKLATCIHQADDGTEVFLVADNHKMGCKGCGRERAHDVYLAIRDEPGGKQWREFAACCRECQTREVLG